MTAMTAFTAVLRVCLMALPAILPALKSLTIALFEWATARVKRDTERLKKETGAGSGSSGEVYVSDEELFE